ncbi:MAG: ABC transporter permease [Candidatus Atribacteria bacterium]|nr:ABC transporter permease [Candidatus Atribacteria bacterium]
MKIMMRNGYKFLGIIFLFILWEFLSFIYPPILIPSIERVFSSLIDLMISLEFWKDLGYTLGRVLVGFGLSLLIGSVLGLLAGFSKKIYEVIKPIFTVVESIPPIIWIIFAVIWFGLGHMPVIFAIMSIVTPIIFINFAQGVMDIDPDLIEMARAFSVKRSTELRHLYLPSITGYFFSSLSIGLGFTWRVVIMAEFIGSMTGIGNKINWAMLNLTTDQVFAYTLFIVSLGMLIEFLLVKPLSNYSQKWKSR